MIIPSTHLCDSSSITISHAILGFRAVEMKLYETEGDVKRMREIRNETGRRAIAWVTKDNVTER
jgi:hypothetical protein